MTILIVVGDDHAVVREGIVGLLQHEPDLEVLAQAGDGAALVDAARRLQPDLVITDLSMPILNGIEAIRRVRALAPHTRVLCLSVCDQPRQVVAALDAGASGYVLKDNSYDELLRAIRCVMSNRRFLSAELMTPVMETCRWPAPDMPRLTSREREIVQLFSEGFSTQEIAGRLHVSAKTVATHREHVFQKLDIRSIAELTRYALREGLSRPEMMSSASY